MKKWLAAVVSVSLALALSGCGKKVLEPYDSSVPPEQSATLVISSDIRVDQFDGKAVEWIGASEEVTQNGASILIPAGRHKLVVSTNISAVSVSFESYGSDSKGKTIKVNNSVRTQVCGNSGYCLSGELEYEFEATKSYTIGYGRVTPDNGKDGYVRAGVAPKYQGQTAAQKRFSSVRFESPNWAIVSGERPIKAEDVFDLRISKDLF
ncbi:hypothetical protein FACS1894103_6240 [Campylobacterota bacterium]|nr:hypothetical protein FACS1894103_6240 [Campylobacterota bacterium]